MSTSRPAPVEFATDNIEFARAFESFQSDANECVAIEDSRNGLLSACRAGIATVVTPSIYTDDQSFDEAALVTENLSGITSNALFDLINGHERPVSYRTGY